MKPFRNIAFVASLFASCTVLGPVAIAASAHNSQIGAAGPISEPYDSSAVMDDDAADVTAAQPSVRRGEPRNPCGPNSLKTELERRYCNN